MSDLDTSLLPGNADASPKKSVSSFKKPNRNFIASQQYKDIKTSVVGKKKVILHCHGFPGTGKTEIVRKLAEEFPYESNHDLCIKWHIECEDEGHDAQVKLQELVKSLFHSKLITEEAKESVINDLQRNRAGSLAELLRETNVPVLIIFEDVTLKTPSVLSDLLRSVDKIKENTVPFHVYIATSNQTVLEKVESEKIDSYLAITVKGFNEDEAIDYLLSRHHRVCEDVVSDSEKEAARQVFQRFSGSILGLKTARGFCERSQILYEEYMTELVDGEKDLLSLEIKGLEKVYGTNVRHIFQAITFPFEDDTVNLKVMSCLSYLHHNSIPRELLSKLFYHFLSDNRGRRNNFGQSKIKAGQLISTLEEFDLCENSKDLKLHEVVLHAFRFNLPPNDQSFGTMVRVLAGSVTKDIREPKMKSKMKSGYPHIKALLEHVKENQEFDLICRLLLIHLYEVCGSVAEDKMSRFKLLSKAFQLVFQLFEGTQDIGLNEFISKYEKEDLNEVSEKLVESSIRFGDNMAQGLTTEYGSCVLMLQEKALDFLESEATDRASFSKHIREKIKTCPIMGPDIVESLRESELFLSEILHRRVFLAERLVSILHSASRIVLYFRKLSIGNTGSLWLSRMATTMSVKCREKTGVGLLFEDLSVLGGHIPIGLRLCKSLLSTQSTEYAEELTELKQACEAALAAPPQGRLYENGLIKEVSEDYHRQLDITRQLIRIHSRLVKVDQKYYDDAVETCDHLYSQALANVDQWNIAKFCLLSCGKFYASGAKYELALQCFESYLDDPTNKNSSLWSFGVYNFARSVELHPTQARMERAVNLCQAAVQPITTSTRTTLRRDIQILLDRLLQQQ